MASLPQAPLAPRPVMKPRQASRDKPALPIHHSDREWAAVYPHIERLYVHERRKLKYVMDTMEDKYNFKATLQMYKKRFTKWGFYKNRRRGSPPTAKDPAAKSQTALETTRPISRTTALTLSPTLSASDAANLVFLISIQTWSTSFFDTAGLPSATPSSSCKLDRPMFIPSSPKGLTKRYDPEELSFSFRVIVSLLKRGQGVLAGRLARKAFLDVEAILQVEGPLFIWNMLEILYSMASLGQSQLFRMLLLHLVDLARHHFPSTTHPVLQMLLNLQTLVDTWARDSSPLQVAVLQQAWALNAEVVFTRFDPRLRIMYYRLVWDSSLVRVPQDRLREADRWFATLEDNAAAGEAVVEEMEASAHPDFEDGGSIQPPRDYEALKNTSLAAIQHRNTLDLREPSTKVRVLSGLLKSRILDDDKPDSSRHPPQVSRLRARVVAFLMKILVEVDQEMGFEAEIAIERMRSIIALRDYGQKQTGPQIVHELWQLEDLLLREGHKREAAEIRRDAFRRLEGYLDHVPVHEI